MAQAIANASIRQSRFDPRRKAGTEQRLFDQLPQILEQLASQSEFNLELDGHRMRLDREGFQESCAKHYQRIKHGLGDSATQLLLDPACAYLPGLAGHFDNPVALEAGNLSRSIQQHRELITAENGDIHYITSLPAQAASASPAAAPEPEPKPAPPQATAALVEPSRYRIEYESGRYTLYPGTGELPRVNGAVVSNPLQLRPGDVLEAANGDVLTISAGANGDGAQT
jgi:hypothetical protein